MLIKIAKILLKIFPLNYRVKIENYLRLKLYDIKKQPGEFLFWLHNKFLHLFYKHPDNFAIIEQIPKQLNDKILKISQNKIPISKHSIGKTNNDLLIDRHSNETLIRLEQNIQCVEENQKIYQDLHNWLYSKIRNYSKSPFVFVNTRTWITKPSSERFGPNENHTDGIYQGHFKIMLYSTPLNDEHGKLIIKDKTISNLEEGTSVCFLNSDVLHSGIPGTSKHRISTEITCFRTFINLPQMTDGHFFGRHYKSILTPYILYIKKNGIFKSFKSILSKIFIKIFSPFKITIFNITYSSLYSFCNNFIKKEKLNIGSGRRSWLGWECLDAVNYPTVKNINLSKDCIFPLSDKSIKLAYTSHNLEHLDDKTVNQIFSETKRVLSKDGIFIVKVPDFEYFLDQYKFNNTDYISNLGFDSIVWSWKNKNIQDNLENRTAMMFGGYWNKFYGDHFSGNINYNQFAYHGPPIINKKKLSYILKNYSIREISEEFKNVILLDKDFQCFNHQNAWARKDMQNLFKKYGFKKVSSDKNKIFENYIKVIPDLNLMENWSMYCIGTK